MINLGPEDSLTWAGAANEDDVIVMASSHGRLSTFPVREVRKASLASTAVRVRRAGRGRRVTNQASEGLNRDGVGWEAGIRYTFWEA